MQCSPWLARLGDSLYTIALQLNRHLNSLRARLGLPYWSLSRCLKLKVKRAVSFIGSYEAAVAREARRRGVDGVICGHIHHVELRDVDGITYANDGDWVEDQRVEFVSPKTGRRSPCAVCSLPHECIRTP